MNQAQVYLQRLNEAASFLRARMTDVPRVCIILGSGLDEIVNRMTDVTAIPYAEIPHFPVSTVAGHPGKLVLGRLAGNAVAIMAGRVHLYEGYPAHEVVFGVRTLGFTGVKTLFVTNSAGALNPSYKVGDFMLLTNHIGLFSDDPSEGVYSPDLGPLFYDMFEPYDSGLQAIAQRVAGTAGIPLHTGVYVLYRQCSYETKAEILLLRQWGADALGKSTIPEVLAARQMGMRVVGISCISSQMMVSSFAEPLTHAEVLAAGRRAAEGFEVLVRGIVAEIYAE